ncbi:hypothetical protein NM208_g14257 [Fusarium decemcellulare]|uniref:Uncharacterized protein n=1 Tax=Fusarium decemcellulare TaxID=57161 RepID=A0ACC1RJD4_9HYPO|nr:hypothetical protein NM208_g14257 [Fusarium decemcellulare]
MCPTTTNVNAGNVFFASELLAAAVDIKRAASVGATVFSLTNRSCVALTSDQPSVFYRYRRRRPLSWIRIHERRRCAGDAILLLPTGWRAAFRTRLEAIALSTPWRAVSVARALAASPGADMLPLPSLIRRPVAAPCTENVDRSAGPSLIKHFQHDVITIFLRFEVPGYYAFAPNPSLARRTRLSAWGVAVNVAIIKFAGLQWKAKP